MHSGITRRSLLQRAALGAAVVGWGLPHRNLSGGASPTLHDQLRKRPHIVLYLSDDHGIDFAGCYGNADVRTPNIDALAREGMRFTGMFAASPTCAPSRSALYTGLYPARNGCMGNHTTCRPDITALPTYLR
ncbi:MAG: twin-arginine translocation signal domain-containing protein, partial [Planctomycetes bacterium]|nr:twin-arginine translocation signal domain-containing protein [Planctomycetota bacterium]